MEQFCSGINLPVPVLIFGWHIIFTNLFCTDLSHLAIGSIFNILDAGDNGCLQRLTFLQEFFDTLGNQPPDFEVSLGCPRIDQPSRAPSLFALRALRFEWGMPPESAFIMRFTVHFEGQ